MAPNPYGNAITSEGILQYTLAQLAAQDAADRSRLGGYVGGLIGDYGAVPGGYQDKYGSVTPEVRALAEKNPYSFIKQNERQTKQATGNMMAQRAARGVVQSGGTAAQAGEIGYQSGLANYQALRGLLGDISGAESNYADAARGRFDQQAGAYGDTVGRLLEGGFSPVGATTKKKRIPTLVKPKYPTLGPKNSGPLIGVNQGTAPYIGTRP